MTSVRPWQHLGLALVAAAGVLVLLPLAIAPDVVSITPAGPSGGNALFPPGYPGFSVEYREQTPVQPGLFGMSYTETVQVTAHVGAMLAATGVGLWCRPLWTRRISAEAS